MSDRIDDPREVCPQRRGSRRSAGSDPAAARPELRFDDQVPVLLGNSAVIREVHHRVVRLAQLPWPVRVEGPRGSGKRVVSRLLHAYSPRALGPFVSCNVNLVPDHLELSKLVGHTKGAFTGAERDVAGAFEAAHTGTLVLDEVADASCRVQGILLQLVEERSFSRIGEVRIRAVNVRIVVATNADLAERVLVGGFRADLLDRLGTCVVKLPALADHSEDIPQLIADILPRKALEAGLTVRDLTSGELDLLQAYTWPGNVRELQHVMEEFVAFGTIAKDIVQSVEGRAGWRVRVDECLRRNHGNKAAAARALGIARQTLYSELERRTQAGGMEEVSG